MVREREAKHLTLKWQLTQNNEYNLLLSVKHKWYISEEHLHEDLYYTTQAMMTFILLVLHNFEA